MTEDPNAFDKRHADRARQVFAQWDREAWDLLVAMVREDDDPAGFAIKVLRALPVTNQQLLAALDHASRTDL